MAGPKIRTPAEAEALREILLARRRRTYVVTRVRERTEVCPRCSAGLGQNCRTVAGRPGRRAYKRHRIPVN